MKKINAMPAANRPREKLQQKGPAALSDVDVTQRLRTAGETLGIRVLDHLIFDARNHYSFVASGLWT